MKLLGKKVLLFFAALILTLSFAATATAQSNYVTTNERVIIDENRIIDHDYFAAGERVDLAGIVNGDAYIAGGNVTIDGKINGDLLVAGGQVSINGAVTQNVRVAGGDVVVRGSIGKNLTVLAGNVTVENTASIDGNFVGAGGNMQLRTPVKDVTAAAGMLRLENSVSGNVTAAVGKMELGRNASVGGDLDYWSDEKAQMGSGAIVKGHTHFHQTEAKERAEQTGAVAGGIFALFHIVSFISALIVGLLLTWLAPVYTQKVADTIMKRPFPSIALGLAGLIIAPILFILLLVTIIGLPIGLMLLAGLLISMYVAKIFVAVAIGSKVLAFLNKKENMILAFVIGIIIYYVVSLVPFLGSIAILVAWLAGMGALWLQKKEYYQLLKGKKLL